MCKIYLKLKNLKWLSRRFSPRTAFSFSFMWNNPPLGWKIEILTVANHCLHHPLFPPILFLSCLLQDSKLTKQYAEHKQHSQTSIFYNEETWQNKPLTDGEIHKIIQIQISILSGCRRPEGVYIPRQLI